MPKMRLMVAVGVLVLSSFGCDRPPEKCEEASEFIGLRQEQARVLARTKGVQVRVLTEGEFATSDLRSDRVNLSFDGDSVATATYC